MPIYDVDVNPLNGLKVGACIHGNNFTTCVRCSENRRMMNEFVKDLKEAREERLENVVLPGKMAMSSEFEKVAEEIGKLVTEKNKAYGDSFAKTGEFLLLLYPDGIKPEQYGDALSLVRIFDKMMRIATDRDAFGESPYRDIAGYSLLGIVKNIPRSENKKELLIENKFYDKSRKVGSPAGVCPSCLSGALYRTGDNKIRCTECRYEDADILAIP